MRLISPCNFSDEILNMYFNLCVSSDSEMQAFYLKSVRSPALQNRVRMTYKPKHDVDIFSQVSRSRFSDDPEMTIISCFGFHLNIQIQLMCKTEIWHETYVNKAAANESEKWF